MVENEDPPPFKASTDKVIVPPEVDPDEEPPEDTFNTSNDEWRQATCLEDLWRFTTGEAAFCPGSKYITFRTYHGNLYAESCKHFWSWTGHYLYQGGRNPMQSNCKMAVKFNESSKLFNFICEKGYYIEYEHHGYLTCCSHDEDRIWGRWEVWLKDGKEHDKVLKDFYMRIKHPKEKKWWKAYKGSHNWCVNADEKSPDNWCLFYPWKTGDNYDDWKATDKKVCLGHLSSQSGDSTLEVDQTVGRSKSESSSMTVSKNVEFSAGADFGKGFSASVTTSIGCDWTKVSSSAYEVSQTTKVSTQVKEGQHKGIYQVHGMWGPFVMHAEEWSVEDYHDE